MTARTAPRPNDPYDLIGRLNGDRYRIYGRDGYLIWLNVSESRQMAKRAVGRYEPEKFAALSRLLAPGLTMLDIGANKGDFTLFAAPRVGSGGRIVAFEPHPDNISWLNRSIEANGFANITVVDKAVADRNGAAELNIGPKSGHHSLTPLSRDRGTIPVALTTLDAIWKQMGEPRIDIVKIDVEGAEDRVIAGGMKALGTCQPTILLDVHDIGGARMADLDAALRSLGYAVTDIASGKPAALHPDRDFLLTPPQGQDSSWEGGAAGTAL